MNKSEKSPNQHCLGRSWNRSPPRHRTFLSVLRGRQPKQSAIRPGSIAL